MSASQLASGLVLEASGLPLLFYLLYILCPLRPTCHPLKGLPKAPSLPLWLS